MKTPPMFDNIILSDIGGVFAFSIPSTYLC